MMTCIATHAGRSGLLESASVALACRESASVGGGAQGQHRAHHAGPPRCLPSCHRRCRLPPARLTLPQ
eukprot:6099651-Prymnesium_polylepis.1